MSDGTQRGGGRDEGGETKQKGKKWSEGGRRETVHYKRREEDVGERDREEQQRVGSKQEGGATGFGEQESRR